MQLSAPVKAFIENNIILIEENDLELFFYNALFGLHTPGTAELVSIVRSTLDIDPEPAIKAALVEWCKDSVALQHRKKVSLGNLLKLVPKFDYDMTTFRHLFVEAVKTAYPNKTLLPDNYGIEYIVEKQ